MALSAPAALIEAHYRSTWNQILRTAGVGGKVITGVMIGVVILVVTLPAAMAFRFGLAMGAELAQTGDPDVVQSWNALQATLIFGFAFLGSFRFKPAFPSARWSRYPLTRFELLLAEVPASLIEVFPLLGIPALIMLNAGLTVRMPAQGPLILLLTMSGIVTFLSIMYLLSAVWSAIARGKRMLILLGVAIAAGILVDRLTDAQTVKKAIGSFSDGLASIHGFEGVLALERGDWRTAVRELAVPVISSAFLMWLAVRTHARRLISEVESANRVVKDAPFRFRNPSSGIGRLFLHQLLRSKAVRAQLFLPLLFSVPVAWVTQLVRSAEAEGKVLPENLLTIVARMEWVPWFAVVPVLAIAMNPQIWMNQFGFDRGGIRTMLGLPIESRDLLAGKHLGLLGFTAIQTAIAILPLFLMRMPSVSEILIGLAAGGTVLIVTNAVGHVVSFRFPRAIDGTSGVQIPMHLSWISPVTLGVTCMALIGVHAIGNLLAAYGGVAALLILLAGTAAGYRAMLPRLGTLLDQNRERLVGM